MGETLQHSGTIDVRANAPGSPPGLFRVNPNALPSQVDVIAYDQDEFLEQHNVPISRLVEMRSDDTKPWPVTWIDVVGLGDSAVLEGIGELFDLHPLTLEDILHVAQRPKVEEYESYNFIVLRMSADTENSETEQLAIVQFDQYVITFQERTGDSLEPVRERIRQKIGRVRRYQADYLSYAIIDAVVDHYAPLLEWLGDRVETIEHRILTEPKTELLGEVYELKHELLALRRAIEPMRDAIGQLHHDKVPRFSQQVDPYLRDCYDHVVRLIENLSVIREAAAGLMDLYMSSVGFHMNEIMKVLTVISTIFIPLSFIVGLYGMNFDPGASDWNMPELGWRYGYPVCVGLMLTITGACLLYFRRKGWLRSENIVTRFPPRR